MKKIPLLILSVSFLPSFAWSADIYKSVDDQGHVVYSNRPQASRPSEKVKLPPLSLITPATAPQPPLTSSSTPAKTKSTSQDNQPFVDSSLLAEYKQIQDQLIQAISAKDSGIEPLEGERTFNGKNKSSFLNDSYHQRQNALAKKVQDLQSKMSELAVKLKDQGINP